MTTNFARRMAMIKAVLQSVYILGLVAGGVLLGQGILGEGKNIYWVAALLVATLSGFFFAVHWWRGWKHIPTLRVVMTGCLGAGTLIVAGQWFTDNEPDPIPMIVAGFVLVGWVTWDQFYNRAPRTSAPEAVPAAWNTSGTAQHIVLIGTSPKDPSYRQQVAAFNASEWAARTSAVGADEILSTHVTAVSDVPGLESRELLLQAALPLLAGGAVTGGVPYALVIDPDGQVLYSYRVKDRRYLPTPTFMGRIVNALEAGEPIFRQ